MDDEIFNIGAIKVILEHRFDILDIEEMSDSVMNGQEAIDIVAKNVNQNNHLLCNYDLILMDCNMPIMDGYESSKKIREFLHSHGLPQPIILAVTGHTEDSYVKKAW